MSSEDLTGAESAAIEANLQRYSEHPMPDELNRRIKALIVPHTKNMGLKHVDVMECIRVSFPAIVDYLRDNPTESDETGQMEAELRKLRRQIAGVRAAVADEGGSAA